MEVSFRLLIKDKFHFGGYATMEEALEAKSRIFDNNKDVTIEKC